MDAKEKRREVADLAHDVDTIEQTIEIMNGIMGHMASDGVDSEYGEILFMWNKKSSLYIHNYQPIMIPPQPEDPPENAQTVGVNLVFSTPLKYDHMHSGMMGVSNRLMLRAMERLKVDLLAEQKKFEKKLNKLVQES